MICFSYIFSKYFMSRFSFAGRAITEVLAVAQRKRGEKSSIGGGKTMGFGREFGKKKTKEKKIKPGKKKRHFQEWELELWCGVFDLE